jgi:serine/threonine-protein kinase
MAPEQARQKTVDRRADVFAMGIVLWETLASKRLFKGEGEAETLNRVLFEPIPTVKSANPNVPAELDAICAKALERDPDKRWATCSDFADALEKVSRQGNYLAANKEVAAHIQAVIGTDVSQQREALRAWLTRSEPSRQMLMKASQPSQPSQPESSSVSSAVIALQAASATSQVTTQPRPSRVVVGLLGAAVVALVAVGVMGFVLLRKTNVTPDTRTTVTTPPPTMSQNAQPTPQQTAQAGATTAIATDAPVAPSASMAMTTVPTTKATTHATGHKQTAPTTTKPTGTATTVPSTKPTLPDENPYR